jgi:hypothetical protein
MNPMLIAAIGGAAIFFFWKQRQAKADVPPTSSFQLGPSSVPQEWIEMTPEGYSVTGSTSEMYDILT